MHTFEKAGTYNVILTAIDTSNQNASDSAEINVGAAPPPNPSVEIMPSSIVGFAPATIDFEASVIGQHVWNWLKLFALYLHMGRVGFMTFLVRDGG